MKFHAVVSAAMLGLMAPVAINLPAPAMAQPQRIATAMPLEGTFGDRDWLVTVGQSRGSYRYFGYNLKTNKSIELHDATVTVRGHQRLYTWNNGGTKYRVTWQPQDRDYVRIQVISPNRQEILNRLLSRQQEGCSH